MARVSIHFPGLRRKASVFYQRVPLAVGFHIQHLKMQHSTAHFTSTKCQMQSLDAPKNHCMITTIKNMMTHFNPKLESFSDFSSFLPQIQRKYHKQSKGKHPRKKSSCSLPWDGNQTCSLENVLYVKVSARWVGWRAVLYHCSGFLHSFTSKSLTYYF